METQRRIIKRLVTKHKLEQKHCFSGNMNKITLGIVYIRENVKECLKLLLFKNKHKIVCIPAEELLNMWMQFSINSI